MNRSLVIQIVCLTVNFMCLLSVLYVSRKSRKMREEAFEFLDKARILLQRARELSEGNAMSDEKVLLTVREIDGGIRAIFCGSEHQLYACIQTVVEASVNAGLDKEMVMFAVSKGIAGGMRMRSKD